MGYALLRIAPANLALGISINLTINGLKRRITRKGGAFFYPASMAYSLEYVGPSGGALLSRSTLY